MISLRYFFTSALVATLAACGGGVDVAPVEGEWPPAPKTGTVQIELADPAKGTLTRLTIDLTGVTRDLTGLYDDAGNPLPDTIRSTDFSRVCYMSDRAGWNEQARACTDIYPGKRPADEACYDEYGQRTSCPTAYLGDSSQVVIFHGLRNNDAGILSVLVAATGKWYKFGVSEWPCTGAVACSENANFLREYGGYRPATGVISCQGGVPTARIHFGTDALSGFGPVLSPGEAGDARYSSDMVGWAEASSISGSIGRDASGDYFFELTGLPAKEADGTFVIRNSRSGEWSWMDPAAFAWNTEVAVNPATYHLTYDLGRCP